MNKKALVLALMLLAIPVLTVSPALARPCGRRNISKVDFLLHIENPLRIDDDVRWWFYPGGESGTGTPPDAPEGALKSISKGFQHVLQGTGTYLQIGETQIPLTPEDQCKYDVYSDYDVDFPVLVKLKYFVREKVTFDTAEFKGFIKIYSIEDATFAATVDPPYFTFEASGTCFGYGRINGKFVVLYGERHLVQLVPTILEDSGTIKFLNWQSIS